MSNIQKIRKPYRDRVEVVAGTNEESASTAEREIRALVERGCDPMDLAWESMVEAMLSGWQPDSSRETEAKLDQMAGLLMDLRLPQDRREWPMSQFGRKGREAMQ